MRDSWEGEDAVKAASTTYLPATASMVEDGFPEQDADGTLRYAAYRTRAYFPGMVRDAVERLVGAMTRKPAVFALPEAMTDLITNATPSGETLETLLMRIYESQLLMGRIGLLADVPVIPEGGETRLPWIVTYSPESIINWVMGTGPDGSDALHYLVLDESGPEFNADQLQWNDETLYLVLLVNGQILTVQGVADNVYAGGSTTTNELPVDWQEVIGQGGGRLNHIPFTFVNSVDLVSDTVPPPLIDLARIAFLIYRGESDYRQTLFMQGQDTLVTRGEMTSEAGGAETRVGAGAKIRTSPDGGAEYVGVNSAGLPEQRLALQNDYSRAEARGGQMLTESNNTAESGDALKIRVSSRTTTLSRIALVGAAGLRMALQDVGRLMGLSEEVIEEIDVTPNLDFTEDAEVAQLLLTLVQAKNQGAPLSWETIHALARKWDLTALDFLEEISLINNEVDLGPTPIEIAGSSDESTDDDDNTESEDSED